MEFRTKLVTMVHKKKATLAYVGLGIAACSLILLVIPSLRIYVTWAFVTGIVVVLVGAYIAKGDIAAFGLSSEELYIDTETLRVGAQQWPLKELKKLDFDIAGYAGMKDTGSAYALDGMGNRISFQHNGRTIERMFYLAGRDQTRQLGELFRQFYELHIPFVERTGNTRTYLFRDLDADALAEFKKKYGYA